MGPARSRDDGTVGDGGGASASPTRVAGSTMPGPVLSSVARMLLSRRGGHPVRFELDPRFFFARMPSVPTAPQPLRWALRQSGLDVKTLRQKFKRIDSWLDGTGEPSLAQLRDFAKRTRTPLGFRPACR